MIIVLILATGAAWWAGAITPRFGPGAGSEYGANHGTIFYGISLRNTSRLPVTIIDAGRSGTGLELTAVEGDFPITLQRDEEAWIKLYYQVTDCPAVTADAWPVPVTVERPWGTKTVYITLPTQRQSQWQGSTFPPLQVVRNGPVEWQRSQTDVACALLG
ncbi:hypothetical protein GCM10027280_15240 [Micromonospora polyrhachis]|uniref:Uncharacterized protein n=1 Tax=Micromonospora polyrhachis TaxID=1282883 RepID=A0A7W7SPK4_9ACTN|nr:hypothetical protein [Micromonospora polyrhachis]MBB4958588.1 hypothetical protein [Micromonospora polyrhachis]